MQNVQCMLQPCMMETKAVACCGLQLVVANGFGRAGLFLRVANRKTGIIHPPRPFLLQELFDVIRDPMKFLRAHHEVHMRQASQKRVPSRLRHASEKSEDDFRPALRDLAKHPHFPERLLLRHVANAAGVEEDDIRFGLMRRAFITTRDQRVSDLFGVALIHLAAVGFDEEFRHGESGIVTQSGASRQNEPQDNALRGVRPTFAFPSSRRFRFNRRP